MKGVTKLYSKKQTANGIYYGVPLAQWRRVRSILGLDDIPVKDMRPRIKFPQDLQWTGKLRDGSKGSCDQIGVVDDFWNNVLLKEKEAGIIKAVPRSGKSYMSTNIAVELGFRTLITCSEIAWLEQFVDALIEMTNVAELDSAVVLVSTKTSSRSYANKPGIKVVNHVSKLPKEACVVLVAYQAFTSDTDKVLSYLHGKFTTLIVDECHQTGAFEFTKLLNNLDVVFRISLSATVDRNDGMTPVVRRICGNVGAVSETIIMVPDLQIIETGVSSDAENPVTRITALAKSDKRNKIVLQHVFDDLNANDDNCLFIPVARVSHMLKLTGMINQQAAHDNSVARNEGKAEPWSYPLALSYYGGTHDHKHVRTMAATKQVRVVVAVFKKVKHGISIPAWNIVYTGLHPIADGPGFYQLSQRVCTPPNEGDTKPNPVIKHFIDSMPASAITFANLWDSRYNALAEMVQKGAVSVSTATQDRILQIIGNKANYHGPIGMVMGRKQKKPLGGFMGKNKRR